MSIPGLLNLERFHQTHNISLVDFNHTFYKAEPELFKFPPGTSETTSANPALFAQKIFFEKQNAKYYSYIKFIYLRIQADVKRWSFNTDGNHEGWTSGQLTTIVSGGKSNATTHGGTSVDPRLFSPANLGVTSPSTNRYVHVLMNNITTRISGRVYFITNADPTWKKPKSKAFTIIQRRWIMKLIWEQLPDGQVRSGKSESIYSILWHQIRLLPQTSVESAFVINKNLNLNLNNNSLNFIECFENFTY